jgi:hypothetical protein
VSDDVVRVLTAEIEAHVGLSIDQLKAAVAAEPRQHPQAAAVVRWHALLVDAQHALDRAETGLLAALAQPGGAEDPVQGLAERVAAAAAARDGRVLVLRYLLNPEALGQATTGARSRRQAGPGPAVPATAPARPAPRQATPGAHRP